MDNSTNNHASQSLQDEISILQMKISSLQDELVGLQMDIQDNERLAIEYANQLHYLAVQAYQLVHKYPNIDPNFKSILGILLLLSENACNSFNNV